MKVFGDWLSQAGVMNWLAFPSRKMAPRIWSSETAQWEVVSRAFLMKGSSLYSGRLAFFQ